MLWRSRHTGPRRQKRRVPVPFLLVEDPQGAPRRASQRAPQVEGSAPGLEPSAGGEAAGRSAPGGSVGWRNCWGWLVFRRLFGRRDREFAVGEGGGRTPVSLRPPIRRKLVGIHIEPARGVANASAREPATFGELPFRSPVCAVWAGVARLRRAGRCGGR